MILSLMIDSNNLQTILVLDTGLLFPGSPFAPFLKIGDTCALSERSAQWNLQLIIQANLDTFAHTSLYPTEKIRFLGKHA